jgi:O-acetyl-ADP-ribose deacetylase (regulator of RNase III)
MIEETSGDIFSAKVDALINAVNTVGVMGKGLALAFKKKFPDNFTAYQRACKAGDVKIGTVFMFDRSHGVPRWIINFPTKRHWREASKLDDIRSGLVDLLEQIQKNNISAVAMPALGCGLGGLDWGEVRPLILEACGRLPTVRFLLFAPQATP